MFAATEIVAITLSEVVRQAAKLFKRKTGTGVCQGCWWRQYGWWLQCSFPERAAQNDGESPP